MAKEIQKSVLEQNFNYSLNQASPVQKDFDRKVDLDDDGNEYVTYVEVDYPKLQVSLGIWKDWSLASLLKAGIDPAFPIHTGMNTRIEGVGVVDQFVAEAESILAPEEKED